MVWRLPFHLSHWNLKCLFANEFQPFHQHRDPWEGKGYLCPKEALAHTHLQVSVTLSPFLPYPAYSLAWGDLRHESSLRLERVFGRTLTLRELTAYLGSRNPTRQGAETLPSIPREDLPGEVRAEGVALCW